MPEEKNKKQEKLEYLEREEIRTMQKDIAKLRELEAKKEREKIGKIKTEEEVKKEGERQERAKREAEERKLMEEKAKRKDEELKKMRGEREKKTKILEKEDIKKEEVRVGKFRETLQESQIREEEERRRFLARVEAKAEGKEEELKPIPLKPPTPTPPPAQKPKPTPTPPITTPTPKPEPPSPPVIPPVPPSRPAPPTPPPIPVKKARPVKLPKPFIRKPSFAQKLWFRITLTTLVLVILVALITFWYWYLIVREESILSPSPTPPTTEEPTIPLALISVDNTKVLNASALDETLKQNLGQNKFTRILIKDVVENKFWGLKEFFQYFTVNTPENFYSKVNNDFTLFIYSSQTTNRLGFVAKIIEKEEFPILLNSWETSMEKDFEILSLFLGKEGSAQVPLFKEADHQSVAFRYISFPPENFGICWALVNDYLVFTFSGESIIKTIDKINE